ncbi:MAG: hypothetical protein H0V94_09235 [Actinobacteria bacterium]|nr:hypothetical protein [Actinomycetota bacterium]
MLRRRKPLVVSLLLAVPLLVLVGFISTLFSDRPGEVVDQVLTVISQHRASKPDHR